jgi:hypothetical protein
VCRSKYPCRRCPGVEPQRTASGRLEIDGCGVSSNRDKRQNAYRDNGTEKLVCTFQFASPFDHWFASGKEIHHWCSTGKVLIKFPPRCCTGQTTTTRSPASPSWLLSAPVVRLNGMPVCVSKIEATPQPPTRWLPIRLRLFRNSSFGPKGSL